MTPSGKASKPSKKTTGRRKSASTAAARRSTDKRSRTTAKKSRTTKRASQKKAVSKSKSSRAFSGKVLADVEESLLERRQELLEQMNLISTEPLSSEWAGPGDVADSASASFQMDVTAGILESETRELQEIDNALMRLKEKTYGVCQDCGCRIPASRLKAVPHATLCIECKMNHERERPRSATPQRWQITEMAPHSLDADDIKEKQHKE